MEQQVTLKSRALCSSNKIDSFSLNPVTALKLLCAGIEALVKLSEDVTPISLPLHKNSSKMGGSRIETENGLPKTVKMEDTDNDVLKKSYKDSSEGNNNTEEALYDKSSLDSMSPAGPYVVVGENIETPNAQCSAIIRKFYSKSLPSISLVDYLMRIHKFCPMPTAVYLATSCYIHKLAADERTISVTRRNCHRLVLAGLRVTMKALEDQSYAHSRFSKVGGVTTGELARLEINFCFLINFDFIVSGEALLKHAKDLKTISSLQGSVNYNPRVSTKSHDRSRFGAKEVTADA